MVKERHNPPQPANRACQQCLPVYRQGPQRRPHFGDLAAQTAEFLRWRREFNISSSSSFASSNARQRRQKVTRHAFRSASWPWTYQSPSPTFAAALHAVHEIIHTQSAEGIGSSGHQEMSGNRDCLLGGSAPHRECPWTSAGWYFGVFGRDRDIVHCHRTRKRTCFAVQRWTIQAHVPCSYSGHKFANRLIRGLHSRQSNRLNRLNSAKKPKAFNTTQKGRDCAILPKGKVS